ncbi:MAG: hypothetical protein ACXWUG_05580 [Polyangiales bacterium]
MSDAKEKSPGRPSIGFVIVLAILAAAPTVGDVGGCGTQVEPLDATKFFTQELDLTCSRCDECGILAPRCKTACDTRTRIVPHTFVNGCNPVVHDGEVCINALEALSCSAFDDYVERSVLPTECDFCPQEDAGTP